MSGLHALLRKGHIPFSFKQISGSCIPYSPRQSQTLLLLSLRISCILREIPVSKRLVLLLPGLEFLEHINLHSKQNFILSLHMCSTRQLLQSSILESCDPHNICYHLTSDMFLSPKFFIASFFKFLNLL